MDQDTIQDILGSGGSELEALKENMQGRWNSRGSVCRGSREHGPVRV